MSKNIFATITHVAEKITEAITDHKNDEQAHPTLTQQINVLSNESEINLSISTSGETISTRIKNSIAKGKLAGRYRYTSGHSSDAPIPKHAIISYKKTKQSTNTDIMFFADSGEIYTSTLNGSNGEYISDWKQIATTTKTDILFQGAATTTFTLAKSFSGYDEFKVMGYTASHTHSTYTHNNFDFNTLGNTESGYLVFGVGVVQFQCNGTEFKILSNPNNVIISKIVAIKRGDK